MPLFLQIAYVTVAGKYLKGAPLRAKDATWGQKAVGAGYAQVPVHSALWEIATRSLASMKTTLCCSATASFNGPPH